MSGGRKQLYHFAWRHGHGERGFVPWREVASSHRLAKCCATLGCQHHQQCQLAATVLMSRSVCWRLTGSKQRTANGKWVLVPGDMIPNTIIMIWTESDFSTPTWLCKPMLVQMGFKFFPNCFAHTHLAQWSCFNAFWQKQFSDVFWNYAIWSIWFVVQRSRALKPYIWFAVDSSICHFALFNALP